MIDTQEQVSISEGGATEQKAGPLFLCRCGQSSTKPYCDASHRKAGFKAGAVEIDCG
jgi:CDGSH-type Zn-finger protein